MKKNKKLILSLCACTYLFSSNLYAAMDFDPAITYFGFTSGIDQIGGKSKVMFLAQDPSKKLVYTNVDYLAVTTSNPNGNIMYANDYTHNTFVAYNIATQQTTTIINRIIDGNAITADGKKIYANGGYLDLTTNTFVSMPFQSDFATVLSKDETLLYTLHTDSWWISPTARTYNTATGEDVTATQFNPLGYYNRIGGENSAIEISKDGSKYYAHENIHSNLEVRSTTTNELLQTYPIYPINWGGTIRKSLL